MWNNPDYIHLPLSPANISKNFFLSQDYHACRPGKQILFYLAGISHHTFFTQIPTSMINTFFLRQNAVFITGTRQEPCACWF
jgi:hypothetical protein